MKSVLLGRRPGGCILLQRRGSRPEGSRGWTWVRLVGEWGRLRLRLTMTLLRRFFDVVVIVTGI